MKTMDTENKQGPGTNPKVSKVTVKISPTGEPSKVTQVEIEYVAGPVNPPISITIIYTPNSSDTIDIDTSWTISNQGETYTYTPPDFYRKTIDAPPGHTYPGDFIADDSTESISVDVTDALG